MMDKLTCAVIGCHPTRFKFKYQEHYNGCKKIKKVLDEQLRQMYADGVRRFVVAGTLGVGIWAGELLLRMKEQTDFAELELVVVLPYDAHDSSWDSHNKKRLAFLLNCATDKVKLTANGGVKNYRQAYHYMVEQCQRLIAVCDEKPQVQDDAGQTVQEAQRTGRTLLLIHPDNAKVTA